MNLSFKPKEILLSFLSERFKFSKNQKIKVGLDIGSNALKALVLEMKENQAFLSKCKLAEISEGADLNSSVETALNYLQINNELVNISFSGQPVIIRYAWLPLMNEKELESSLKFEAAKLIPFSIEEVNVDSFILKQNTSTNKMLVLIVAAKKNLIDERIGLLQNLGYNINIIDVDSLALINAFNFNYPHKEESLPKVFALLNIGAAVSNLNIIEEGLPVFSRDIYIAGNNFTKKISDLLGVEFKQAEDLKINPPQDKLDKIITAVEPVLANLASEIRISFDYYESQGASIVDKIFLSGGTALFHNLKDNLKHVLGIDIDYWDPFKRVSFGADCDIETIKPSACQFAVSLGLAMR